MDAVIFCNGVRLEEEAEPVKDKYRQVCINTVPFRLRFEKICYYFHEAWDPLFRLERERDDLHTVQWTPYPIKELDPNVFPMLVFLPGMVWTALHYLICHGYKNIYCAGMNLENWPNGMYNQNGKLPGDHVYDDIRHTFRQFIIPSLEKYGVSFSSSTLNWKPGDPVPPKCYVV